MKINWKVRFSNPQFIAQLGLAVIVPILAYAGLTLADVTSWATLGEILFDAVRNPYVLGLVAVSVYNAIPDPTVAGLSDSPQAMAYTKPRKDGDE